MNDHGTPQEAVLTFGSREELEQRLSLIPSGDRVRGFVLTTTLDAVRSEVDAAALRRCIDAAGQSAFIPFFNYPMRSLLRLLYTGAWELSARHGGFDKAMWHLGARSAPDFLRSSVGRMLLAMSGMDVKRLVAGIPVAYPAIYDHGSCTLSWTEERSGRIHLQGNLMPPPFIEGAVLHVCQAIHHSGLTVQVRRVAPRENVLTVSWE